MSNYQNDVLSEDLHERLEGLRAHLSNDQYLDVGRYLAENDLETAQSIIVRYEAELPFILDGRSNDPGDGYNA